MQHLVSIIMPAYNAEKYIAESIRSVLDQTYQNWELIVVDDGSKDQTAEIVQSFLAIDKRIKYIFQQNGRLGKARNTGINNAAGDLIAFLDSDDLWVREKLELQVKTIEATKVDLVYSDGFVFSDNDTMDETCTFSSLCDEFVYDKINGTDFFNLLFAYNRIAVLSALVRKNILEEVGPFEEGRLYHGCEDYDLWLRLAKHGAVFYGMKEKLVRYRRHSAAMTYNGSELLKPMIAVVRKHCHDSALDSKEVQKRLRTLYRNLISTLIEENKTSEAKEYMKEFSAWDKVGVVTLIQKILIEVLPSKYNFISKECLYRTEWHVNKTLSRLAG